ncbi:hypothetical protein HBB16_19660 [Pseudonocardia sp. MCCB 268]|nr:hypothetical protein [Pseudonocardia cytotoxica]
MFVLATTTPVSLGVLASPRLLSGAVVSGVLPDDVAAHFLARSLLDRRGHAAVPGSPGANGDPGLLVSLLIGTVRGAAGRSFMMFALGRCSCRWARSWRSACWRRLRCRSPAGTGSTPLLMGVILAHGALGAAFSRSRSLRRFANGWLSRAGSRPTRSRST